MNRIQNEISRIHLDSSTQQKLSEAQKRQHALEHGGLHKYVRIGNGCNNLRLLCRIDEQGNLLPKELDRIRKVKQALGIKE